MWLFYFILLLSQQKAVFTALSDLPSDPLESLPPLNTENQQDNQNNEHLPPLSGSLSNLPVANDNEDSSKKKGNLPGALTDILKDGLNGVIEGFFQKKPNSDQGNEDAPQKQTEQESSGKKSAKSGFGSVVGSALRSDADEMLKSVTTPAEDEGLNLAQILNMVMPSAIPNSAKSVLSNPFFRLDVIIGVFTCTSYKTTIDVVNCLVQKLPGIPDSVVVDDSNIAPWFTNVMLRLMRETVLMKKYDTKMIDALLDCPIESVGNSFSCIVEHMPVNSLFKQGPLNLTGRRKRRKRFTDKLTFDQSGANGDEYANKIRLLLIKRFVVEICNRLNNGLCQVLIPKHCGVVRSRFVDSLSRNHVIIHERIRIERSADPVNTKHVILERFLIELCQSLGKKDCSGILKNGHHKKRNKRSTLVRSLELYGLPPVSLKEKPTDWLLFDICAAIGLRRCFEIVQIS